MNAALIRAAGASKLVVQCASPCVSAGRLAVLHEAGCCCLPASVKPKLPWQVAMLTVLGQGLKLTNVAAWACCRYSQPKHLCQQAGSGAWAGCSCLPASGLPLL